MIHIFTRGLALPPSLATHLFTYLAHVDSHAHTTLGRVLTYQVVGHTFGTIGTFCAILVMVLGPIGTIPLLTGVSPTKTYLLR